MASRNYHFKFNTERDKTYIERLDAQDNMQNYIRRLILSDIAADSLRNFIQLAPDPELEEKEPDDDAIEFQRRADLMEEYCPAADSSNKGEYVCDTCKYSYFSNWTDDFKCRFTGLNSDEIERLVANYNKIHSEVMDYGSEQI